MKVRITEGGAGSLLPDDGRVWTADQVAACAVLVDRLWKKLELPTESQVFVLTVESPSDRELARAVEIASTFGVDVELS